MPFTAPVYAHMAAFLGYAMFALLLAFRGSRSWLTMFFVLAAALTAAWAGSFVLAEWSVLPDWVPDLIAPIRDGGWYVIVLTVLYFLGRDQVVWRYLVAATATVVLLDALFAGGHLDAGVVLGVDLNSRVTGIAEVILGLVLVENMMRNLGQDQFWSAKHFGIGLSGILLFQLMVLVPEFLTNTLPIGVIVARPLVFLLMIPLFVVTAVRSPGLELRVHSSRKIVFQTTALIAIGVVLQGAAIAAYYLRTRGGDNGTVLSILLGFGTIVGFAVALASRSVHSRVKSFINENFFSYKYDYRLEWEKFIHALSASEDGNIPLRVLRTLAELLDSPGGGLWVWRESWNRFMPVARWSLDAELTPLAPNDRSLIAFEDENCTFLELTSPTADSSALLWQERFPAAWLAVAFRYRSSLVGFALINRPRVDRTLHWEDKNLISLVALQLAAYLVQQETAQALADARQLEEFNKRFAFILHDTKNAIGQLSLLVRNAELYGHKEEFRKDMVVTLRHSVEKLEGLLAGLTGGGVTKTAPAGTVGRVDVAKLTSSFVQERRRLGFNVVGNDGEVPAIARLKDDKAFLGVLEHVVTNALEATPDGAPVHVRVGNSGAFICVSVEDQGPGMTQQFIADELFRPLKTTKKTGFGIGAYQAREIMRDLGGDIDVHSTVGEGTTVALSLPAVLSEREVVGA